MCSTWQGLNQHEWDIVLGRFTRLGLVRFPNVFEHSIQI